MSAEETRRRREAREIVARDLYQTRLRQGQLPTYDSVRREVESVADRRDKIKDNGGRE